MPAAVATAVVLQISAAAAATSVSRLLVGRRRGRRPVSAGPATDGRDRPALVDVDQRLK
jgi:hypothetical protein